MRLGFHGLLLAWLVLGSACSGKSEAPFGGGEDGGSGSGGVAGTAGAAGSDTGGSNTGGSNTGGSNTGGSNTGGSNTGGSNTGGSNTGGSNTGGSNTGGSAGCPHEDDIDHDGDGYSFVEGDCDDCNANRNPGAFDFADGTDDDCDGAADNGSTLCDAGLALDDADARNGARAIGLCKFVTGPVDKGWGVIDARYVKVDGTPGMNPLSKGLPSDFGAANPQSGQSMLVLSSGTARAPGQPGYESPQGADMATDGNPPLGYPKESAACPGVVTGECMDPAALEIEVRVPTNAVSLSFDFNFYTFEFPDYLCSQFNDFFVTMMNPIPAGLPDGNVVFDVQSNPVSVNTALLQVCEPQVVGTTNYPCPLGTALLDGTGFEATAGVEAHAATGWLRTIVPVEPGETITLRFAIWDSGDHILDSTVAIDNFRWV